jgi:hypothetical protein
VFVAFKGRGRLEFIIRTKKEPKPVNSEEPTKAEQAKIKEW